MDAEIKAKWLNALRSGDYQQAQSHLRSQIGFCCLGVLCDIHSSETGELWKETHHREQVQVYGYRDTANVSLLPLFVGSWSGIDCNDVVINTLMNMNDNGASFAEIADYIEKTL